MLNIKGKAITLAVTLVVAGTVGVAAASASNAVNSNMQQSTTSSASSYTVSSFSSASSCESQDMVASSSALTKNEKVNKVANSSTQSENTNTSSAESKAPKSASSVAPSSTSTSQLKRQAMPTFAVINPSTGALVYSSDSNYEKYKAELGGDAGTVPTNQSTACQAALKKIEEAYKEKMASSQPEKELQPGQANK
ncbi:MAG TPA: hypothetical protein VHP31_11975 [Caproicibacter sp.]|nr:hypothetical protein [Caproicibacter sp.]